MLKPSKLYEEELQRLYCERWYDDGMQFYTGFSGSNELYIPDNDYEQHHFASVDNDGNVIGFIAYHIDYFSGIADNFGIMSFKKTNYTFAKDLYTAIDNLFMKYKVRSINWRMIGDNPVEKHYRRFCKKYGGREVGKLTKSVRFADGSYHDDYLFELTRENYLMNREG